jgi:hypothetical protein
MPGGYGTDESTPWGAAGTSYVTPGKSSSPYKSSGSNTNWQGTNQGGSNAVADAVNKKNQERLYKQSNEYLNNPDNFSSPQEQYAATLKAYNAKYGIAGGSVGLGSSGYMQYTNIPGVYKTTYPKGTTGYSPTGYQYISGPGALYENGKLVDGSIQRYTWPKVPGGGGGGGGGGWGGWSGSWGGPGGFGSGMGGAYSRRWNPHMKNVNNYNSPIAQVLAQREANKYNNLPKNQWMFTQMLQSMPGGGITEAI